MANYKKIEKLAKVIRYYSLVSTTEAGSGHPTSSLSATDLMATLMFGGFFKFDANSPKNENNDRLLFSKGHASPLFYSLWLAAGKVSEKQMLNLRKFGSPLEGHPTPAFKYTEAATGSLGQGLSIGVGMALNAKYLDKLPYKTFVLLGDSEMAEGSVWEAMEIAAFYKLNNLVGIIDVNRLGQRGQTMYGHNLKSYSKKIASFGWKAIEVDGHSVPKIAAAYKKALASKGKPVMIVAKTLKGKGVKLFENKGGWHGKALNRDQLEQAIKGLGSFNKKERGKLAKPLLRKPRTPKKGKVKAIAYSKGEELATRKAYGKALARIYPRFTSIVSLDAEVSNSTYAETFKNEHPERFFEMFIAEQNMVGTALGLANRGKIPFVSTFAAFLSRAHDQIRMSQYSNANIKFVGSHAGVSIGQDGGSQMALEDLAMMRSILGSVVLYPSDAVSTEKLVEEMAKHRGISYMRTTRVGTPVLYKNGKKFVIGGSKTVRKSKRDKVTIVSAGITLHEAIAAHETLKKSRINARVIDLYSVKPVDRKALLKAARETRAIITVEDHFAEGGIGEAVKDALSESGAKVYSLAVRKMPRSGTPKELMDYEQISRKAIVKKVKSVL